MKLAVVLFALAALVASVTADACSFPNASLASLPPHVNGAPFYFTETVANVRACLSIVSHSASDAMNVIGVVNTSANLYSFTDLAKSTSGLDYNLNVDLLGEIDAISKASYSTAPAFYYDLVDLFRGLKDLHAVYYAPYPLSGMTLVTPFALNARLTPSGDAEYYVSEGYFADKFQVSFGADPSAHYGKVVAKIDGVPINTWISSFAAGIGRYKALGVQVNDILGPGYRTGYASSPGGLFTRRPLDQFNVLIDNAVMAASHTYLFADSTTVTISNGVLGINSFTSASDFLAQTKLVAARKRSVEEEIPVSDEVRRFWFAPGMAPRRVYDQLPESMPAQERVRRAMETIGVPMDSSSSKRSTMAVPASFLPHLERAGFYPPTGSLVWYDYRNGTTGSADAMVIKLTNFFPVNDAGNFDYATFRTSFEEAITHAKERQFNKLILDVSNNIGGSVAVAEQVAMYLVGEWDAGRTAGVQTGYMTFDQRKDPVSDQLYASGSLNVNDFKSLADFTQLSAVQFYAPGNTVTRTRGGQTGPFSTLAFFDGAGDVSSAFRANNEGYYFDQIIAVTDGRCGSACSQFITHLRAHDRVRVAFVGGLKGSTDHDISSYSGGARYSYNDWRNAFAPALPVFPVSGSVAFNWRESYTTCYDGQSTTAIPRDFSRIQPDAFVYNWNFVQQDMRDTSDTTGLQNSVDVYREVFALFPQVPYGLPTYNRTRGSGDDVCSGSAVSERLTPISGLSFNCYGEWQNITECSVLCGGGSKTRKFKIYAAGDPRGAACEAADGFEEPIDCNTQACDCTFTWNNYTLCSENCDKSEVFRIQGGALCPFTNGTVRSHPCGPAGTDFCPFTLSTNQTSVVRAPVVPIVHCVDKPAANNPANRAIVYLGYNNLNDFDIYIPGDGMIAAGGANSFSAAKAGSPVTTFGPDQGQPVLFKAGYHPFAFQVITQGETGVTVTWKLEAPTSGQTSQVSFNFLSGTTSFCAANQDKSVIIDIESYTTPTPAQLDATKVYFAIEAGLSAATAGRFEATVSQPAGTEGIQRVTVTVSATSSATDTTPLDLLAAVAQKFSVNLNYVGNIASNLGVSDASKVSIRFPFINQGAVISEIQWDQPAPLAAEPIAASSIAISVFVVVASLLAALFV